MTTTDLPRPRFARMYVKAAARADRRGATQHRRALLQGLSGRVLEIGVGNGLNFAHYPATVTEVVAIEPEPTLRDIAQQAAAGAPVPVSVREGTADAVPLEECEMDAAGRQPRAVQRPRSCSSPTTADHRTAALGVYAADRRTRSKPAQSRRCSQSSSRPRAVIW
jgi:SAM-dependent methyltransferase